MSELLQTGQHPDADQLSAFVEHALPAHEQEWMLAHLAVCPDCRSVVAVSMPPVEELPEVQPKPVRRPWFSGWNLVWPVAAAFAAILLIVVMMQKGGGNAPPTQVAETRVPEKPAVGVGVAPAQPGPPAAPVAGSALAGQDRLAGAERGARAVNDKAPAQQADESITNLPLSGRNIQSLPPSAATAAPLAMGGMGSGSVAGVAQGTQVAGSGLNVRQSPILSAGLPAAAPVVAPPPTMAGRAVSGAAAGQGAAVGAASTTVTTAAATTVEMADATSDNALAAEPVSNASSMVISGESLAALASERNVARHPLPSGLPVLSVAAAGGTMLALDSGNALFLSADAGAHWKQVRAKWQGRAVKVTLAVTPAALAQRPVAEKKAEIRGALQGRIGAATEAAAAAPAVAAGNAALTGQVTDPTGAAIPGVAVKVTNAATGAAVKVKTDAGGRYFAGGLAAGAYRIDATAQGFASQELAATLAASQQEEADLKLRIGQETTTVAVTDAPAQLDTESNSLSDQVVVQAKDKKSAAPLFAITTDAGVRWVSADGKSWKRE